MAYGYPYGNGQQLNLDWFLEEWKNLLAAWEAEKNGIDGALQAEIDRAEAALADVFAARDAAAQSAANALESKNAAAQSASDANGYLATVRADANTASNAAQNAAQSESNAADSAQTALASKNNAAQSAQNANASKEAAAQSASAAADSQTAAGNSANAAAQSAEDAYDAAASVEASAQQITTNTSEINNLKETIKALDYTVPLFVQSRWKLPTEGGGVYLAPNVNAFNQWCRTAEIIHIVEGTIIVPSDYYAIVNTYPYNKDGITATATANYVAGSTITFTNGWYGFMFRHADYSPITPKNVIDDIKFDIITSGYNKNKVKAYFMGYKGLYDTPGDCTVFITPNGKTILVDSLKPECAEQLRQSLWLIGISNFDVVIISHYHIDHIGGIVTFLQSGSITFNNCTFYMANQAAADWAAENLPDSFGASSITEYETLKTILASHSEITQVFPNTEWQTVNIDNVEITFFNTDHAQYTQTGVTENYNDFSLGNYIYYGSERVCLFGDAGIAAMTKMSGKMYTANIYKAQHHGLDNFRYRYYANIIGYWLSLNPEMVVSEDGTYHDAVIDSDVYYPLQHWCEENCIPNYRTNINGIIRIEISKEQTEIMSVAERSLRSTSLPSADKEENT